jgi:hypothetical protein
MNILGKKPTGIHNVFENGMLRPDPKYKLEIGKNDINKLFTRLLNMIFTKKNHP